VTEKSATKRLTASQRLAAQQRAQRKAQAEALKAKRARQKAKDKARISEIKAHDMARLKAEKERLKRLAQSRREHDREAAKRLKERQKAAKEALKEAQHLLARARRALSKSQRKKQKTPVRYLSPKSIAKKAQELKEKGAKLAPEKPKQPKAPWYEPKRKIPLYPPKKGYITTKCFDAEDIDGILAYLNAIHNFYISTGGNMKSPIYRDRLFYYYASGRIQSTKLFEPSHVTESDLEREFERVQSEPDTKRFDKEDTVDYVDEICVTISWSRDFLKTQKGWSVK